MLAYQRMSKLETYLFFDGTCADAMHFYERTLGGKLEMMAAKDVPGGDQKPPGVGGDKIMHARLDSGDVVIMASDWMASTPYLGMNGFSVSLTVDTLAEAKKQFDALSAGGKVTMPFDKTFYADGFGMLVDRFGTPWMVITTSNAGK